MYDWGHFQLVLLSAIYSVIILRHFLNISPLFSQSPSSSQSQWSSSSHLLSHVNLMKTGFSVGPRSSQAITDHQSCNLLLFPHLCHWLGGDTTVEGEAAAFEVGDTLPSGPPLLALPQIVCLFMAVLFTLLT